MSVEVLSIAVGFTLSKVVSAIYWCMSYNWSSLVMVSSRRNNWRNNWVVGSVVVWVSVGETSIGVGEKVGGIRFRISFTLVNKMTIWIVDIWGDNSGNWGDNSGICGVGCNVSLDLLNLGVFDDLSDFVLLFSDFDGGGLLWNTLFGHTFGVVGINILYNRCLSNRHGIFYNRYYWFYNRYYGFYNRYYWVYNIGIGVDERYAIYTYGVVRVDKYLSISFWLSQSNSNKGKQGNKAEHC